MAKIKKLARILSANLEIDDEGNVVRKKDSPGWILRLIKNVQEGPYPSNFIHRTILEAANAIMDGHTNISKLQDYTFDCDATRHDLFAWVAYNVVCVNKEIDQSGWQGDLVNHIVRAQIKAKHTIALTVLNELRNYKAEKESEEAM